MDEVFTAAWYPWYPDKFLKSDDASSLTAAEEGWYRRALDRAWMKGSVPSDPGKFADVIGKRCTVKAAEKILDLFWKPMHGDPSRRVNTTLEHIRVEQEHKYHVARERASKGGKAKASKHAGESASSTAQAMPAPSYRDRERDLDSFPNGKDKTTHSLREQAVAAYRKAYPESSLDLPRQMLIEDRVNNLPAWQQTLTYWTHNGYRAQSVGKMLDCMDEQGYKRNGSNKQRNSTDPTQPEERVESIGYTEVHYLQ